MVRLLTDMAKNKLIDKWSSQQMIAILEHQEINTLLPEPLPQIPIAHKTGSFADTLNDVGIVYAEEPYVIAVLTTDLPSLGAGRQFIHRISRVTYAHFQQLAKWRAANGFETLVQPADTSTQPAQTAPATTDSTGATEDGDQDVPMWATPAPSPSAGPALR
jgi:hypothetical protein